MRVFSYRRFVVSLVIPVHAGIQRWHKQHLATCCQRRRGAADGGDRCRNRSRDRWGASGGLRLQARAAKRHDPGHARCIFLARRVLARRDRAVQTPGHGIAPRRPRRFRSVSYRVSSSLGAPHPPAPHSSRARPLHGRVGWFSLRKFSILLKSFLSSP